MSANTAPGSSWYHGSSARISPNRSAGAARRYSRPSVTETWNTNMSSVATVRPAYITMASEITERITPTHIFCRRRIGSVFCAAITFSVPVNTKYAASAAATSSAITAGRSIIERQRLTKSTFCVHSSARISGLSWNRNAHLRMARMRGESSQCR